MVSEEQITGLKEILKTRFEPSLVRFTVVPKNRDSFSWDNAGRVQYEVLNGRHLLLAMKAMDKDGLLTALPTLEKRKVTCYVLKSNSSLVLNYSNLRQKDLESYFTRKPPIHSLITVHQGLRREVGSDESFSAVVRYANTLGFQAKDKEALKKLLGKVQYMYDYYFDGTKLRQITSDLFLNSNN